MRDFVGQSEATNTQTINIVFRESVHWVLEKIKNEPYFKWPNKWQGSPQGAIRIFIANTTRTTDISRKTAGTSGTIWTS